MANPLPKRKPRTTLLQLATMMRGAGYNAYIATLVGSPAQVTERLNKRMMSPQVGDLVFESTTFGGVMRHKGGDDLDGVGILEEIAMIPVVYDDPEFVWDEVAEGMPHPTEKAWRIRTFDGRLFTWTNASIVAIVTDRRFSWPTV